MIMGIAAAPSAWSVQVRAEEATRISQIASTWNAKMDFDLARDLPPERRKALLPAAMEEDAGAQPATWKTELNGLSASERLGPHWMVRPLSSGPAIEFAALGAGKRERPGLMHLALDWNF